MEDKKECKRFGLVKLEVFVNVDDLEKGKEDFIEIDFNYSRGFIKEEIKELVEKFGNDVQDYLKNDEEVEANAETNDM